MASVAAPPSDARPAVSPASPSARPGFVLAGDLRIHLFAMLFALATIHHELQLILELQLSGPLTEYMERWGRAVPTIGWPSGVGIALHLADILVSVLILALPWRRALLLPLAITFPLVNLVSPHRIPSHNSFMLGALAILLIFAVAELTERATLAGRVRAATDWYGWTLRGLTWLCVLTYFSAAFHKLNPVFLSPATSPAPLFVLQFLRPFPIPRDAALALANPVINATVAIECVLPILLLVRRTRLFGCLLGTVFHLAMMAYGIMDFPVLILGFYPLFMGLSEARALAARLATRPSVWRLISTVVIGVNCAGAIWASSYVRELTTNSRGIEPLLMYAHSALLYATVFLFAYVTSTLAALLLDRWPGRAAAPAPGVACVQEGR